MALFEDTVEGFGEGQEGGDFEELGVLGLEVAGEHGVGCGAFGVLDVPGIVEGEGFVVPEHRAFDELEFGGVVEELLPRGGHGWSDDWAWDGCAFG